jgi:radical SAM superfamily enzyme YgiQ (UPF0313 family)
MKNLTMKKVLLLNPPGEKLYIREYFCSKVSQADYIPPPIDLVMLSGILARDYSVTLIDAVACGISREKTIEEIRNAPPDAIISLVGAASVSDDLRFLREVKAALPGVRIVGIGDVFMGNAAGYLQDESALDAVLLNFVSNDIITYLKGDADAVRNMVLRDGRLIREMPLAAVKGTMRIPMPQHELFLGNPYRHPFVRRKRFASVLTEYGCPFHCSFCIMATLGYAARSADDVIEELKHVSSLGVRDVLFSTQTFGADQAYALEICRRMTAEKIALSWTCFSRVDVATPALLSAMKEAGCHTIIFGIESGSEKILGHYRKGYTVPQIRAALEQCASLGIETAGTFILGLPEEDHDTIEETLGLLRRVPLDYASFNVAVPRAGTPLREEALSLGLTDATCGEMDQSGSAVSMPTAHLSREEVRRFRARAVRTFYLRWGYLAGRIRKVRSLSVFIRQVRQGLFLFFNTWVRK